MSAVFKKPRCCYCRLRKV